VDTDRSPTIKNRAGIRSTVGGKIAIGVGVVLPLLLSSGKRRRKAEEEGRQNVTKMESRAPTTKKEREVRGWGVGLVKERGTWLGTRAKERKKTGNGESNGRTKKGD